MITKVLFVINISIRDLLYEIVNFILTDYSSQHHNSIKTNIWELIHQVLGALLS